MTKNDFIKNVVRNYADAHFVVLPHERVLRGKSRPIYSICEDILAYFIASNIEGINILVNQSLRYANKNIIPDLSVIRDGVLTCLIELKQDLGWCRNLHDSIDRFEAEISELVMAGSVLAKNSFSKDQDQEYNVSPDLKRCIAVISDLNISKDKLEENKRKFSCSNSNLLQFLTTACHPNAYSMNCEEIMKSIVINDKAFDMILSCSSA